MAVAVVVARLAVVASSDVRLVARLVVRLVAMLLAMLLAVVARVVVRMVAMATATRAMATRVVGEQRRQGQWRWGR